MSQDHQLTRLPNGLRVVTERMPSVRSVALGFWIGTGSRSERDDQAGLSHLLEHGLFKGTPRIGSLAIDQLFDEMGAELNAGTGRETTSVYSRVLDIHLDRALEVMADMVFHPSLTDLDSEREVILEEIAMYEDDPQDKVFDVLGGAVFGPDHPLGRPIIGRREVVAETPSEQVAAFHAARYTPANVVISAAGSVDHEALVARVADAVDAREGEPVPLEDAWEPGARRRFERKDTEQYHVCLGGPGLSRDDDRRFALRVLDNIVGGTGSSRLFQEIREQRGLAYAVYSFLSHYAGAGQVGLYLGTRADNLAESMRIVDAELERLQDEPASEDELRRAKENVKGRLVLALESTTMRSNRLGSSILTDVELLSVDELIERVDAVSLDDLRGLAHELWAPDRLSVVGIGPDEAVFDAALEPLGALRAAA